MPCPQFLVNEKGNWEQGINIFVLTLLSKRIVGVCRTKDAQGCQAVLLDIGKLPPYSILTFTGPTRKFPAPSTVYHLPAGNWMVWDTPCVIYPMRYSSPVSVSVNTTSVSQSPLTFTVWNKGCICSFFFSSLPERGEGVRPLESGPGKDAAKQKESSQQEPPFLFHQNTSILLCCLYYTESFCGEKYGAKFYKIVTNISSHQFKKQA